MGCDVETIVQKMSPAVEPVFGAIADRPFETSNVADVRRTAFHGRKLVL